jgi:hypothetical protein
MNGRNDEEDAFGDVLEPEPEPEPEPPTPAKCHDRCGKCRRRLHGRFTKCPSCGAVTVG